MQVQDMKYSRPLAQAFLSRANHDELKWTINYIIGLLEMPDVAEQRGNKYSLREAKSILSSRKLKSQGVPSSFNGMRDEVNPKYL